jgi:hypothetical protein
LYFVVGGVRVILDCFYVFVPVLLGLAVPTILPVYEIDFLLPHESIDALARRQMALALAF